MQLFDLRLDDDLAISHIGMILKILPMIIFGVIELAEGNDLGDNRSPGGIGCRQRRNKFLRLCFLLGRGIKYRRTIFRADVIPLPIERGRIVRGKKFGSKIIKGDLCRLVFHACSLCMASRASADGVVRRMRHRAAGVTRQHPDHAA